MPTRFTDAYIALRGDELWILWYITEYWVLIFLLPLQLSQTTWPSRVIHQNFYDLYIAGRSYEEHYRALFEQATDIRKRRDLYDEISNHFLAVHVYVETVAALDIRDKPQFTATSFLSQLGGALNLWAGITVVVIIEIIEFCYEVMAERFNRGSRAEEKSAADQQNI